MKGENKPDKLVIKLNKEQLMQLNEKCSRHTYVR